MSPEVSSLGDQLERKQLQAGTEGGDAKTCSNECHTQTPLFASAVNQSLRLIRAVLNGLVNGPVWSECQRNLRAASATRPKSIY